MDQVKKYRYPGIKYFEETDTDIFFGREEDRKKLADLVEVEKHILLYAKSGLGKSSLLNAALVPELAERGYQSHVIRLGLYQENSLPPVSHVLRKTVYALQKSLPETFLNQFITPAGSLWHAFKSMQIANGDAERPVVLIFDQFEEIGSYPERYVDDFKQQLAELLYNPVPADYLHALKGEVLLARPLTEEELELLYKPLRIKAVFAIRSDQLSVVNELSDYLPNILKVFYELKPLTRSQALKAIVKPAGMEGNFITPTFSYRKDALDKITSALSAGRAGEIDTAQLQILLQYIEQDLVAHAGLRDFSAHDLGDLNKVYENYYLNSLRRLSSGRAEAEILIEDKLIVEGRRTSYDHGLCLQLVRQSTLDELIDTRMIRREPNTLGGYSYEVSHDSLVSAILEAREARKHREELAEQERLRLIREAEEKAAYEANLAEERRRAEVAEQKRRTEKYEAEIAYQIKRQKHQRRLFIIVSVFTLLCLGLGVWAMREKAAASESREELARTQSELLKSADSLQMLQALLKDVDFQRKATRDAMNRYIQSEISRKTLELQQLSHDLAFYQNSNDADLETESRQQITALEQEIAGLRNNIKSRPTP